MKLTAAHLDRAVGAVLGTAAGDALGAGYEFGPPLPDDAPVSMKGGGSFGWAPGEWTDDTSMAIPILEALADGQDVAAAATQDRIVAAWADWSRTAPDVGIQTRQVLGDLAEPTASAALDSARAVHERTGRSAGNGSLMRTGPVALGYLDDGREADLAAAARALSALTHHETDAGDACVLWSLAIRHAIRTGIADVRVGLPLLPVERRELWAARIEDAERREPRDFDRNGWVVEALQAAWWAIHHGEGLVDILERAVRGGRDTDTVAAIAGALAVAARGGSGVPFRWQRLLHGWPGLRARDLARMAVLAARGGRSDGDGWPAAERFDYSSFGDIHPLVRHPHDDGVWIGGVGALDALPDEIDAVVSLCRVGRSQVPARIAPADQHTVWLIDSADESSNPHLDEVLLDAASTVSELRAEGKTVLLHCVQAQSRTPAVAALYSALHLGTAMEAAWRDVIRSLPAAQPNRAFEAAYARLTGNAGAATLARN